MPDAPPPITTHFDGPVAILGLNRPDKRNAQTPELLADLVAAAVALPESCRAVVLTGHGAVFCAGFDMRLVHDDPDALPRLLRGLSTAVRTIKRLPVPVIAAAHGAAVAGGCALLAAADVVVTNRHARLGYPVVRLGISPAVNAGALRRTITDGATRERALDPDLISGVEAARIGLAHHCLDQPHAVLPTAIGLAHHLASKPPHAVAATKRLMLKLDGLDSDGPFDLGLAASLALAGSLEQRDRVAALWSTGDSRR